MPVEHRQVLGLDVRRSLQDHRSAAEAAGGVDLGTGEACATNGQGSSRSPVVRVENYERPWLR